VHCAQQDGISDDNKTKTTERDERHKTITPPRVRTHSVQAPGNKQHKSSKSSAKSDIVNKIYNQSIAFYIGSRGYESCVALKFTQTRRSFHLWEKANKDESNEQFKQQSAGRTE